MDIRTLEAYMRQALMEAEMAYTEDEIPIGAIIVMDGAIIACAHNECESRGDPTAHAELLAIKRAARTTGSLRLSSASLITTLEPCPMCAGAVINARLSSVYFGAHDEQYGCCGSIYRLPEDPVFHHFTPVTGGILSTDCQAIIGKYFQKCRTRAKKE